MNIRFIEEGPALLVGNRQRVLVVADLHIGIEADLAVRGWHVASRTEERLKRLLACIGMSRPDLLILLGDVKHNLPRTTHQEYRELPGFLSAIRETVPIRILPGNHDTSIARFLQPGELLDATGSVIDGIGYFHGHTIPSPALHGHLIIAGHHHPLVSIRDSVGCALRSPAYLLAAVDPARFLKKGRVAVKKMEKRSRPEGKKSTRVLFMPAFNECAGFDVLQIIQHPFSPVSRAILAKSAEIFLPDGTCIGPISSLQEPDIAA